MTINYAILGILSYKPMTGYDLKKIIQNSAFMHWSGNNNQIYRALTELHENGFVINVVMHNEGSPTKKIYTITSKGLEALKEWVLSPSDAGEIKKSFLIRLAWSKQLNTNELNMILDEYESQVKMQLLVEQRKNEDRNFFPDRTTLESTVWSFINDNTLRTYENELKWLQDLRCVITNIPNENNKIEIDFIGKTIQEEKNNSIMKYVVKNNSGMSYVYFNDSETKLETERNILEIITALAENNTQFVLLDSETLLKDFVKNKKGIASSMLQKFTMYQIKSAIVMKDIDDVSREFRDFFAESGKHEVLRLFTNITDAENWFLKLKKK